MLFRKGDIKNVAKNIKEYREKQGLKQTEFAELLSMNYQNYSKMERGVYTPSLDKVLEICETLQITPNDLLLEGREFDDYKQETLEKLDASVLDIMDTMKIVEQQRAKALQAKEKGDTQRERIELDSIIQIFASTNAHYWDIADYLYYKRLDELIQKTSKRTMKELADKLK